MGKRPATPDRKGSPANDAALFGLLTEWALDEALRKKVLVDNPAALYGFGK